jgi:hypothetical protein
MPSRDAGTGSVLPGPHDSNNEFYSGEKEDNEEGEGSSNSRNVIHCHWHF